jgi:hypothetical protein
MASNRVRAYIRKVSGTINTDIGSQRSYAGLYVVSGTTSQSLGDAPEIVTMWTAKMPENIMSSSVASSRIDVSGTGDYDISFRATYSATLPQHHVFEIWKHTAGVFTGTFITTECHPNLSGNIGVVGAEGILSLTDGDGIVLYGSVKSGSATEATFIHAQLKTTKLN